MFIIIGNAMQHDCAHVPVLRAGVGQARLPLEGWFRQMAEGELTMILLISIGGTGRRNSCQCQREKDDNQGDHSAGSAHLRRIVLGVVVKTLLCATINNWTSASRKQSAYKRPSKT